MPEPTRTSFHCIDAHTCGNPDRLVYRGGPDLEGETMLDRQQHFIAEYDWIRTALMFEPRGHAMMSGSILYPSKREDCDIGVLFIETSGCLPMCGHGTIGTVTIAVENRLDLLKLGSQLPQLHDQLKGLRMIGVSRPLADFVRPDDPDSAELTDMRTATFPANWASRWWRNGTKPALATRSQPERRGAGDRL